MNKNAFISKLEKVVKVIKTENNVLWENSQFADLNDMGVLNYVHANLDRELRIAKNLVTRKIKSKISNSKDLKVLIVGNIAMYGLLKALVLQKIDNDCDVIGFDFYHFAGTPEFHYLTNAKINLEELGDDPYFANFWRIDKNLRFRPDWFAQGPFPNCYAYLKLKRAGNKYLAKKAWASLEYNRLKCVTEKTYFPQTLYWSESTFKEKIKDLSLSQADIENFKIARKAEELLDCVRQCASLSASDEAVKMISYPFERGFLDAYIPYSPKLKYLVEDGRTNGWIFALGIEIYGSLRGRAPEKPADLKEEDWQAYKFYSHYWKMLLEEYETAVFQAAYPIIGYTAGYKPYFGYEIGTIRSIPFNDDPMGRQVYAGYKNALGVFVTNSDYPLVEQKIENLENKTIFIPHAFDEQKVINFSNKYRESMKAPKVPFFLSPSRQWWYNRPKSDSKCNDYIVYAAKILSDKGYKDFIVEMVGWGPDVDQTKSLIKKLKVGHIVKLVNPMSRQELWEKTCQSLGVIDQFGIPGFGGVAFETMALASRLLTGTYADNDEVFFGSVPPILRAHDSESLAVIMEQCLLDPADKAGLGESAQKWISEWHSAQRAANITAQSFARML
ncbi:MAG: hypothetical protein ACK41P_01300 [Asticcacaulis sp.]